MKRFSAFIAIAALLLTGCVVVSVFPFYEEGDLLPTKPLEGRWVPSQASAGGKAACVFSKWAVSGSWFENIDEDGKTNLVGEAHLFKLGQNQFLDLAVAKSDGVDQVVRPHLLLKVSQTEPSLKWSMLDYAWLEDLLKREPGRLAHRFQRNEEGKIEGWVLTAETRELRQFLQSIADSRTAWGETQLWHRAER